MEQISRRLFSCDVCDRKYSRRSGLQRHIRTVHEGEPKKHNCSYCEKTFNDTSNRNRHVRIVHMNQLKYECEICHEEFGFKWTLEGHQREYHQIGDKRRCECGKEFSYTSNFYTHQRVCGTHNPSAQERKFPCDICRKRYKSKHYLKKHMKYDHSNKDQLVCDSCGEAFTRPWSLKRHCRRKHVSKQ